MWVHKRGFTVLHNCLSNEAGDTKFRWANTIIVAESTAFFTHDHRLQVARTRAVTSRNWYMCLSMHWCSSQVLLLHDHMMLGRCSLPNHRVRGVDARARWSGRRGGCRMLDHGDVLAYDRVVLDPGRTGIHGSTIAVNSSRLPPSDSLRTGIGAHDQLFLRLTVVNLHARRPPSGCSHGHKLCGACRSQRPAATYLRLVIGRRRARWSGNGLVDSSTLHQDVLTHVTQLSSGTFNHLLSNTSQSKRIFVNLHSLTSSYSVARTTMKNRWTRSLSVTLT